MSSTDLSAFDDLSKLQDDGIDVPILHPASGDALGITIRVAGPDSTRQRQARQAIMNKRLQRRNQRMRATDIEDENIAVLARSILSWSGVKVSGAELDCNVENAENVLRRFPFIREQIEQAAGDRAGFLQN